MYNWSISSSADLYARAYIDRVIVEAALTHISSKGSRYTSVTDFGRVVCSGNLFVRECLDSCVSTKVLDITNLGER